MSLACKSCSRLFISSGRTAATPVTRGLASQRALFSPRWHSTHPSGKPRASDAYTSPFQRPTLGSSEPGAIPDRVSSSADAATQETPSNLSPADRAALESMLRVDHAGEIAANTIYQAQANVFGLLGDAKTKQMMLEMWESEKKHLKVAEKLLAQHLLGKEAAMACTEAVETVIGEHYDDQLTHLNKITASGATDVASPGSESDVPHPSLPLLSQVITEFRDDELEHLDTAVEHDAQQAPAHALLSALIGFGCKGAIQIAKRF